MSVILTVPYVYGLMMTVPGGLAEVYRLEVPIWSGVWRSDVRVVVWCLVDRLMVVDQQDCDIYAKDTAPSMLCCMMLCPPPSSSSHSRANLGSRPGVPLVQSRKNLLGEAHKFMYFWPGSCDGIYMSRLGNYTDNIMLMLVSE